MDSHMITTITIGRLPTTNKEVAVGWFKRYVDNYVRGLSEEDNGYTQDYKYTHGYYVAGIVTPQAYLDSQRAGNVIATYQGNSFDWSGYQVPVDMTVKLWKCDLVWTLE